MKGMIEWGRYFLATVHIVTASKPGELIRIYDFPITEDEKPDFADYKIRRGKLQKVFALMHVIRCGSRRASMISLYDRSGCEICNCLYEIFPAPHYNKPTLGFPFYN